ncbi:conserved hypothetical protein [Desulfovibrionales bacterium]
MTACADCKDDMDTPVEIGNYSLATIVYSGLVAESYLKRSGGALVGGTAHSIDLMTEAGQYSAVALKKAGGQAVESVRKAGDYSTAIVEYAGLVTMSIVKRSGAATAVCAAKMTKPMVRVISPAAKAATQPLIVAASGISRLFKRRRAYASQEVLAILEQKLHNIEKRLIFIEQHGIQPTRLAASAEVRRELSDAKRAMLRIIVEDNKLLRGLKQTS